MSLVKVDYGEVGGGKQFSDEVDVSGVQMSLLLPCDGFKPKQALIAFNFGSNGFAFYYDEDYATQTGNCKFASGSGWSDVQIGSTSGSFSVLSVSTSGITIMLNNNQSYNVKYIAIG